jgi:hypothetical protein
MMRSITRNNIFVPYRLIHSYQMGSSAPLTNQVYKDFNKQIKGFLKELIANFPHMDILKLVLTSFTILKKINKKMPHKMFNKYLACYEEQFLKRDEAFFLSDAFQSSFWPQLVDASKQQWVLLDQVNKNAIWDHFAALIGLNKRCLVYRKKIAPEEDSGDEV